MNGETASSLLAWATPFATVGLLVVTIAYSYFTHQLVKVARLQRLESIRPRLQVAVVATQRGMFFVLRLENVGLSPALNFKATIDRDVHRQYGNRGRINDIPFFREGVPAFMPHTPVDVGLGVSHEYLADNVDRSKHPASFAVKATYEFEGKRYEECYPLEVHDLYAETVMRHTEMTDLVKTLKEEVGKPLKEASRHLQPRSI